ncbi:hypothetical protein Pmani_018949 [Petrolisthes manimaculis]|uniref:Reverse transcriptase domain-containing protein n=1 Tax=Petrolisthes manimaculis TaxID=1843537 RepID=A0AAE1U4G7_9EUCA|nr:hypothetical protein Pmani_018949 [Petrolisthes manimaculis]
MENKWWLRIAAELHGFADSRDLQNFYRSLKQLDAIPDRLKLCEMNVDPTMEGVKNATHSLNNNKSPGVDGIPDLKKAFDMVNQEMLWCVMRKSGCPDKFTAVTRAFYDGMRASLVVGGEETATIDVELGVKQGCVIAPILFNIYLAAATFFSHARIPPGHNVSLTYQLDGSLFHLRRLHAQTKNLCDKVLKLQYSDDCVLITHSPEDLQEALVIKLINTNNTEIFVLLVDCSIDEEVNRRINKASATFGRIRDRVIQNNNI